MQHFGHLGRGARPVIPHFDVIAANVSAAISSAANPARTTLRIASVPHHQRAVLLHEGERHDGPAIGEPDATVQAATTEQTAAGRGKAKAKASLDRNHLNNKCSYHLRAIVVRR